MTPQEIYDLRQENQRLRNANLILNNARSHTPSCNYLENPFFACSCYQTPRLIDVRITVRKVLGL